MHTICLSSMHRLQSAVLHSLRTGNSQVMRPRQSGLVDENGKCRRFCPNFLARQTPAKFPKRHQDDRPASPRVWRDGGALAWKAYENRGLMSQTVTPRASKKWRDGLGWRDGGAQPWPTARATLAR